MQRNPRAILPALLALTMTVAVGCGGDSSTVASETAVGNPTDRAFIAEMIPHHRSAVDMAAVASQEGDSKFVKDLAADITRSQNAEIEEMQRIDAQLADAGIEKGEMAMGDQAMGMEMSADALRGAEPFDEKFIAMMIPHHESAVAMARTELEEGSNPELKELAEEIIAAQEREIKEMREAGEPEA